MKSRFLTTTVPPTSSLKYVTINGIPNTMRGAYVPKYVFFSFEIRIVFFMSIFCSYCTIIMLTTEGNLVLWDRIGIWNELLNLLWSSNVKDSMELFSYSKSKTNPCCLIKTSDYTVLVFENRSYDCLKNWLTHTLDCIR